MKPVLSVVMFLGAALALFACARPATIPLGALTGGDSLSLSATVPDLATEVLPNGLAVVTLEDHRTPLLTILLAVKAGAFSETPETDGLTHFYEHLFFKGNAKVPDQQAYVRRMQELGIVFNGSTSQEAVMYYFTLPKENLRAGLEFMFDAITTPAFDEGEMEREKKAVLAEIDRHDAEPYNALWDHVRDALFFAHPYAKNVLGSREVIRAATPQTMRAMQQRLFVPNNSALFIVGDVEPGQATQAAAAVFSAWQRGADPFAATPPAVHPPLERSVTLPLYKPVATALYTISWQGPRVGQDPKATYAADVMSTALALKSSGFSRRFIDTGLAHQAMVYYHTQEYTGTVDALVAADPLQMKAAMEALEEELTLMAQPGYFTPELLEVAKRRLMFDTLYQRQNTLELVRNLAFWWCSTGMDYYLGYLDNISKVTPQDIRDFQVRYLTGKPRVTAMIINRYDAAANLAGTAFDPAAAAPEGGAQ